MSLGGKGRAKAAESKHEFLERTRKEREEREAQRKREKATLKLQVMLPKSTVLLRETSICIFAKFASIFSCTRGTGFRAGQKGYDSVPSP